MKGIIDRVFENRTREGKRYWVLSIGGENYSVWDKKYMNGLTEGCEIDFDWTQSGDFKKMTDLKKIHLEPILDRREEAERRNTQILRLSCIKSATSLISDLDLTPAEKGEITLEIARGFEKYVKETDEEKEYSE